MVVIYTQEKTIIRKDAEAARDELIGLYGEKFGTEAYRTVKSGSVGTSYRRYGGPLVKVISNENAEIIKEKESAIGIKVI